MPQYTYTCSECDCSETLECKRGEAPKTIKCKNNHDMNRQVKINGMYDLEKGKEPLSKSDKIRKNLEIRQEKLRRMNRKDREKFESWSKDQTGGKW